MGGCIGAPRDNAGPHTAQTTDATAAPGTVGHNKPLKPRKPKWKSDIRLTVTQLQAKRDEFWDTAPAFDGRKEIWDALKASAHALESGDHQLAQAILNGANISLPNGTLMDCYDELGNRYQLPVYVLSLPINIVKEENNTTDITSVEEPLTTSPGVEVPIKVHLSTGQDRRLTVRSTDTILSIKQKIEATETVDCSRQRIFFSGKLLGDRLRVEDAKIHKGYVLQVVVSEVSSHAEAKDPKDGR